MAGPLNGIRIIELAGIGPGPFAGMVLADLGAEVIRVERPGGNPGAAFGHDILFRSRPSIAVNLKSAAGIEVVMRLVEGADALIEGNRPGVAERLGVGPDDCLARNPKLVYGRMTGWGQDGPLAQTAGHDINYIALSGALDAIGRADSGPVPPLNLVGDFGGGAMMLVTGLLAAVLHAERTGAGQVVDVSMVEGASLLLSMQRAMATQGIWTDRRGGNLLDTGAFFYDVYETADKKFVSIGSLEPQFYAELVTRLDLADELGAGQADPQRWPQLRARLAEVFASRTRDAWDVVFEGSDACYAPVLSMAEAVDHPHNVARRSFVSVGDTMQPAPTPRFSGTPADDPRPADVPGGSTRTVLRDAGFTHDELDALVVSGAIAQA
ncbi:MAG: alpha-methylacyl-CoA racemase [Nitriliruptoraceae bacterium]|jgi:alpha-methylacyl-CoA racemase